MIRRWHKKESTISFTVRLARCFCFISSVSSSGVHPSSSTPQSSSSFFSSFFSSSSSRKGLRRTSCSAAIVNLASPTLNRPQPCDSISVGAQYACANLCTTARGVAPSACELYSRYLAGYWLQLHSKC